MTRGKCICASPGASECRRCALGLPGCVCEDCHKCAGCALCQSRGVSTGDRAAIALLAAWKRGDFQNSPDPGDWGRSYGMDPDVVLKRRGSRFDVAVGFGFGQAVPESIGTFPTLETAAIAAGRSYDEIEATLGEAPRANAPGDGNTACSWCDRLIWADGQPVGPKGAAAKVTNHSVCIPCAEKILEGDEPPPRKNFSLPPGGSADALKQSIWTHAKTFPGGPRGYAQFIIDTMARRTGLRSNPALILVHGNPRAPADVERAWCKFHGRENFAGSLRDVGKIPGAPDFTFALGRCVDIDLGNGTQRFTPMPWLVCSPADDALWIVAEKPIRLGSGVAGAAVRSVTYSPVGASGKDPAKYRHKFEDPRPEFSPIGNPNYCRAILLNGGRYRVAGEDWIFA